ncbi:hypothetical protein PHJA_002835800, partial [Phtheirospermum japonicum]
GSRRLLLVGRREHGPVRVGHLCNQKGLRRRINLHALQALRRRFPLRRRHRLRRHGIPSFFRPPLCKIFMLLLCFWCKRDPFPESRM